MVKIGRKDFSMCTKVVLQLKYTQYLFTSNGKKKLGNSNVVWMIVTINVIKLISLDILYLLTVLLDQSAIVFV